MMEFQNSLMQLWEKYGSAIQGAGRKLIIAVLIIVCGRFVIMVSRHISHKAVTGKLKADETLVSVLRSTSRYAVIVLCIIMILDLFGVNTAGLIALLGAAGVAVGFALKDTLGNIAAGIMILFLRPFRKGDFIECGSVLGAIKEIGLFSTIMETADGVFISAPNSNFWGLPLKNYSYSVKRRVDITLTIAYSNSIDAAFRVLSGLISEERRFLADPPPQVMVASLGDIGMGVTMRGWVQSGDYWAVYWEQMKRVKEKIEEAGIVIAVPRRELHLAKDEKEFPAGLQA